jgi:hypothetical protein
MFQKSIIFNDIFPDPGAEYKKSYILFVQRILFPTEFMDPHVSGCIQSIKKQLSLLVQLLLY